MTLYTRFAAHLDAVLDALEASGDLPAGLNRASITVEPPRDVTHGDLSTNAAMVLAKPAQTNPRTLAEKLAAQLGALDEVASVTVAGPGFINLFLTDDTGGPSCRRSRTRAKRRGVQRAARGRRSISNMFPPIRRGQCTWGIAVRGGGRRARQSARVRRA